MLCGMVNTHTHTYTHIQREIEREKGRGRHGERELWTGYIAVSYTHLTLPTIYSV